MSEFFSDLFCNYEKRQARTEVDARLIEGIESGPTSEMTEGDWNELRRIAGDPAKYKTVDRHAKDPLSPKSKKQL